MVFSEKCQELPVVYKEVNLDCGYRIDLLVEQTVILELKAVQELTAIHVDRGDQTIPDLNGRLSLTCEESSP